MLDFLPLDVEEEKQMIDALRRNDSARVEKNIQGPRNPNLSGGHRSKHVKTIYTLKSGKIMLCNEHPISQVVVCFGLYVQPLKYKGEVIHFQGAHADFQPLHHAAEQRHLDTGKSPLFLAAQEGHLEIVRFLLEIGANKDQAEKDGTTPLHVAAGGGHLDIVRFLVEAGANNDLLTRICQQRRISEDDGSTPLHWAAMFGHVDIVRYLVEAGASKHQWHLHTAMGSLLASWLHSRPKSLPRRFVEGETCEWTAAWFDRTMTEPGGVDGHAVNVGLCGFMWVYVGLCGLRVWTKWNLVHRRSCA